LDRISLGSSLKLCPASSPSLYRPWGCRRMRKCIRFEGTRWDRQKPGQKLSGRLPGENREFGCLPWTRGAHLSGRAGEEVELNYAW